MTSYGLYNQPCVQNTSSVVERELWFAGGGLARSLPRGVKAESEVTSGSGTKQYSASRGSADFKQALNRDCCGLPKIMVFADQMDVLISCTRGRNNISKDFKQGLLKLHKSVALVKKEYGLLAKERSVVDAFKEEKSTQTDSFFFAERSGRKMTVEDVGGDQHK